MDTRIKNAAFQLAKSFSDETDIPIRFKQRNKDSTKFQKINTDSYIEKKFQEEVIQWSLIIETLLSKIDNTIAWRFVNLTPIIPTGISSIVNCQDFCDFNDYLILRRDIEKCNDDELGRLAMWTVAFQREIEKSIIPKQSLEIQERSIDFVAIDFETATSDRFSPCEVGFAFVKNGKIIEVQSYLIKPYSYPHFDPFNVMIHGIKPKDVENEPEFPEVWNKIRPFLEEKVIIAHNAGFDLSVLRSTLGYYNLPFPNLKYACSYIISKKVWPGLPSYDLKTLCQVHGVSLNHHRAGNDSKACAEITLKALGETGTSSFDEFPEKLKTTIGQLYPGGYKPSESKRIYRAKNLALITGDVNKHKPESIFYGRTVVFTGTLSSMTRAEAQQIIADIGGFNGNTVTNETDYLVVGLQDYRVVGEDGMSSKQEKAIKLIEKGIELEIISEADFQKNI